MHSTIQKVRALAEQLKAEGEKKAQLEQGKKKLKGVGTIERHEQLDKIGMALQNVRATIEELTGYLSNLDCIPVKSNADVNIVLFLKRKYAFTGRVAVKVGEANLRDYATGFGFIVVDI